MVKCMKRTEVSHICLHIVDGERKCPSACFHASTIKSVWLVRHFDRVHVFYSLCLSFVSFCYSSPAFSYVHLLPHGTRRLWLSSFCAKELQITVGRNRRVPCFYGFSYLYSSEGWRTTARKTDDANRWKGRYYYENPFGSHLLSLFRCYYNIYFSLVQIT